MTNMSLDDRIGLMVDGKTVLVTGGTGGIPRGHTFAERLRGTGVRLMVAYPGHAYTSMNRGLTVGTYPLVARPVVPLLRLVLPVLRKPRQKSYTVTAIPASHRVRTTMGSISSQRPPARPHPMRGMCTDASSRRASAATVVRHASTAG